MGRSNSMRGGAFRQMKQPMYPAPSMGSRSTAEGYQEDSTQTLRSGALSGKFPKGGGYKGRSGKMSAKNPGPHGYS